MSSPNAFPATPVQTERSKNPQRVDSLASWYWLTLNPAYASLCWSFVLVNIHSGNISTSLIVREVHDFT